VGQLAVSLIQGSAKNCLATHPTDGGWEGKFQPMSFFDLFQFSAANLAIDLGTANTVVYLREQGIVLDEPSVVAIETIGGMPRVRAVGDDAKLMMGKTPDNVKTVRPLRNGVVADLEVAEQMIKHFIVKAQAKGGKLRRTPEIVICVPSNSTQVERRAIRDAVSNAGARQVWLIDEPMAAAIGAGLPVCDPVGSMVVDIGGGTTEVGVISIQGLTMSTSVRIGGDRMDEAITAAVRRNHNLLIGEATAERVKKQLGSALAPRDGVGGAAIVKGRNITRGVPSEVEITEAELADALAEPVSQIVQAVRVALESTPPEISADMIEGGITMTGGGSLLNEIATVLAEATGLSLVVADDPLHCVALGAGRALEDQNLRGVLHQV
jgi:rod shape-determining protein MreB and related proteins